MQGKTLKESDVFISYGRRESKAFAARLASRLKSLGFEIWFDQNDIPLGVDFQDQIDKGIERANNFLYIIAPHAIQSPYCLKEIELAVSLNKRIIPILHVEPSDKKILNQMHPVISKINWVYMREQYTEGADITRLAEIDNFEKGLEGIVNILKSHREYVNMHTELLNLALHWQRNKKYSEHLLSGEELKKALDWFAIKFTQELPPCLPADLHHDYILESKRESYRKKALETPRPDYYDAFITYSLRSSIDFAWELYMKLTDEGFSVWFDQNDAHHELNTQESEHLLIRCDNYLYVVSETSFESSHCKHELKTAIDSRKRIIPVVQHDVDTKTLEDIHRNLRKLPWIYLRETDDYPRNFQTIVRTMQNSVEYVRTHTWLLDRAHNWERNKRRTDLLLVGEERQRAEAWLLLFIDEGSNQAQPNNLQAEYICESKKNVNNLMTEAFLCHSQDDSMMERRITRSLARVGITTWDNDWNTGSPNYEPSTFEAIEEADNFLYFLSIYSLKEPLCHRQLEYAISLNKRVLVLLVDDNPDPARDLPSNLRSRKIIDFTAVGGSAYSDAITNLVKQINSDKEYYHQHKVLLNRALKWERQNLNAGILLRGYSLERAKIWLQTGETKEHQPTELHQRFIAESSAKIGQVNIEVFISYSTKDGDFARKINEQLQLHGKTTWFDQESIASGSDFQQEIYKGIEASDNFLFIISPSSVTSPFCVDEVQYAQKFNKRFITILALKTEESLVPPELNVVQWINFTNRDFSLAFTEMMRTIDTDREYIQSHTKLMQKAMEWQKLKDANEQQAKDLLLRGNEFFLAKEWLDKAVAEKKQPSPATLQVDYITDSNKAIAQAQRRQKTISLLIRGMLVVTSILLVLAVWAGYYAQQQNEEAQLNLLIAQSSLKMNINPTESFRLAEKAYQKQQNPITKSALLSSYYNNKAFYSIVKYTEGAVFASATYSPDGEKIAISGRGDTVIYLVDKEGNAIKQFSGHTDEVYMVNFSPDGKKIVSASADNTARIWDIETEQSIVLGSHTDNVTSAAFSHDGKMVLTASWDTTARIWNTDGSMIKLLKNHTDKLNSAFFSPSDSSIVTASLDNTACISNWRNNDTTMLIGHDFYVNYANFSPNGKYIVTASADYSIRRWNLKGKMLNVIGKHNDWVNTISFSSTGDSIISSSWDGTVRLWTYWGQALQTFNGHGAWINDARFSPDGRKVVTASGDGSVRTWSLEERIYNFQRHAGRVSTVQFSSSGNRIVSSSWDNDAIVWDSKGNVQAVLKGHQGWVTVAKFFPDDEKILTASWDKTLRIWDVKGNQEKVITLPPDNQPKISNTQRKNYKQLSASQERDIMGVLYLRNAVDVITWADIAPDGKSIVAARNNKAYQLDLNGNVLQTFEGHNYTVTSVAFSPDGKMVATASLDSTAIVWETSGKQMLRFKNHSYCINHITFAPDGKSVMTAASDNTIRIWNLKGEEIHFFSGHENYINSAMFSPDGQYIISSSDDRTARLWHIDGSEITAFRQHSEHVNFAAFAPDGKSVITASSDKTLKIWQINPDEILEQINVRKKFGNIWKEEE